MPNNPIFNSVVFINSGLALNSFPIFKLELPVRPLLPNKVGGIKIELPSTLFYAPPGNWRIPNRLAP